LWEELGNQIYLYLSSVTLADVCQRRVLGSNRMIVRGAPPELAAAAAGR
jgi:Rrf2 family iron-sulfur cluster assembly transcriptional regulator